MSITGNASCRGYSYPENYVPPTFLSALSKNPNVLPYRYWPLVLGACTISQHISVVFVFLAVFTRLLDHTLDPCLLVALSTEVLEYFCCDASLHLRVALLIIADAVSTGARTVKASLLVFLALISLAPILCTLTAPTSADSIWALATAFLLVHAVLADYSLMSVLSIKAATSAAVVLASRLHDDLAVFALMLFSVEAFALFPILRRRVQGRAFPLCNTMCLRIYIWPAVDASPSVFSDATARVCSAGGTITCAFVTFGAPVVLIEIRGPWDAATHRGFKREGNG
ncbi:phosphatidylinositol N-acetylglucosaminyltransferase subunit C [Lactifluus subvellereus]|nr:phosphatidylinositol N-acetylglucosaminyltransferase subunit C [Lactifluus subvellereus]